VEPLDGIRIRLSHDGIHALIKGGKDTRLRSLYPSPSLHYVRTQQEGRKRVLPRNEICRHLDLGTSQPAEL